MISFQIIHRYFLFFLVFIATSVAAFGQSRKSYDNISYTAIYYSPYVGDFYYSFGLHTSRYDGDLGASFGEDKTNQKSAIRYSLNIGYQLTNYVSLRFDITKYKFKEISDVIEEQYGITRYGTISNIKKTDYSLNIIHDLFPKGAIDNGERRYTPYALLGVGIGKGMIVPYGVGFKYYIFHNLNVAFEGRAAMVLGDKLEDVDIGTSKDFYTNLGFKVTWQKSYKFDYKRYKKKYYHL